MKLTFSYQDALTIEEIINETSNRRSSNTALKQQPIPVIVGPIVQIEASYIIIGNKAYECDSLLDSVDKAFKTCYALDCCYPPNSNFLWMFLQKAYYNIDNPGDKVSCFVNALIGEVEEIINRQ